LRREGIRVSRVELPEEVKDELDQAAEWWRGVQRRRPFWWRVVRGVIREVEVGAREDEKENGDGSGNRNR
jgi:hypothetical protein